MKINIFIFFFFISCISAFSQIKGKVSNTEGKPLPYVNIYLEGTFTGTTTNENGDYELEVLQPGKYVVYFHFLGYKTRKKGIEITGFPFVLNVVLAEESTSLEEVLVNSGENPANRIMEQVIQKRGFHKEKLKQYTADFYSRGIWRIQNAPEKIIGQEVGDLGGGLDSTRSGIIYLSETISEITFKAPNDFKERIIASKVSGKDNGFSLNSAQEATISFYNNTVSLNSELISPLADAAFNYYRFKLEGVFYNERGDLINKIEVTPKRPKDRIFKGFVYIVDDSWQIYGIELTTTGEAMQVPPIEELIFKQNYNYSEENELWVPISQTIDFEFGMLGITGNGRYTAVYTNYDFNPEVDKRTFTNEILSFAPKANKKDSLFWKEYRPVPLTLEERKDYLAKDSIQEYRNSRSYKDSIDRVRNKFRISNLLLGYSFRNSHEKWSLNFSSPLFHTQVNTVQGYNTSLDVSFRKNTGGSSETYWRLFSKMNYGFSEDKFRLAGGFQTKFNNRSKPILTISGGTERKQINDLEPISESINSITTNFFERNYLKPYELHYFKTEFQEEVFNGFRAFSSFSIEKREPLFNSWNSPWIDRKDVELTSNNPLEPFNYSSAPFEGHHIFKFSFAARINFAQNYLSYPYGKYNIPSNKFPRVLVSYEKGFGASIPAYNFDHLRVAARQNFNIGNKGKFGYTISGGTFFNDEEVSFLDLKHFNGNQTRMGLSSSYLNNFNLLPYYALSTRQNYAEAHFEHNFEGWVLGKIPFINQLNYNLVLGAHALITGDNNPYTEYSVGVDNLGFKKFRFLRLDYVISDFGGHREGAFIFGLKFLNAVIPD